MEVHEMKEVARSRKDCQVSEALVSHGPVLSVYCRGYPVFKDAQNDWQTTDSALCLGQETAWERLRTSVP